jgi:DNA-binding CsgD family transcriptional regulator
MTDIIGSLTAIQPTEREVIIYLIVEDGSISNRTLGDILGVSHETIRTTHLKAKKKIERLGAAGLLQTDLK